MVSMDMDILQHIGVVIFGLALMFIAKSFMFNFLGMCMVGYGLGHIAFNLRLNKKR
ncbi:MAG TPA: hypothetical protein VK158_03710 [Acidobacteriota bacterium]|nr:hypothetical protein [Acidobacteriota bacterium]